ncbi:phosphate propanoyltransferase [Limosilactobacillus reuteri]|uniref:phosphate propanoyltransferase n=1 Tax=Limosilactobacillus reuteri TaxID=1598 RepID=UPI001E5C05ED|nr:phosphate propanoyltransferase [Limosilactobacillus reuteri]MCC4325336.1 phosphate propanoyltransferase [Limosilactobacillus reuteri]MCC4329055.1 phosphate propanoyltransferase [Limosilactobacillus reuteri]MCC4351613.1 phosphate propanoyltransferase [Limosilactobacillus reuteri]MCC4376484.1 phosphate propanoyltransferase [Limosilactobacillus reuteri]
MDEEQLRTLIRTIVRETLNPNLVPIGVSNHHVHLTEEDFQKLFPGQKIEMLKKLRQHADFAAKQTVDLIGPKGTIEHVRLMGPFRSHSQVEIARSENFTLGIDAPIRMSGDLDGTPSIKVRSPYAEIEIQGVIVAKRHIHMSLEDAKRFGVKLGDSMQVEVDGDGGRKTIFDDVVARPRKDFVLEMHIDTDEANAANVGLGNNSFGKVIIKKKN